MSSKTHWPVRVGHGLGQVEADPQRRRLLVTEGDGRRFVHADRVRRVPDLDALERSRRSGLAEGLAQARFVSDQYDVQAARGDRGKNPINLDARRPFRAHRIDGNPDLAQELSSSLVSTTMRSL
jgi:hypothetical protein